MADRHEPSHPPSDPHPAVARGLFAVEDRPVRIQLFAALALGLLLVGTGLYLWRRPHVAPDAQAAEATTSASASATIASAAPGPSAVPSSAAPVSLSEPRVVGCHDRGSRTTTPDQCDHIPAIEKALGEAIEHAATCVSPTSSNGSIEYVADVSFSRHKLMRLTLPHAGRSVTDRRAIHACYLAVKGAMQELSLDGIEHEHSRYSIAVTATYRGSAGGG